MSLILTPVAGWTEESATPLYVKATSLSQVNKVYIPFHGASGLKGSLPFPQCVLTAVCKCTKHVSSKLEPLLNPLPQIFAPVERDSGLSRQPLFDASL